MLYRYYLAEEDKAAICADLGLSSLHFNRVLWRARQRFKKLLERAQHVRYPASTAASPETEPKAEAAPGGIIDTPLTDRLEQEG